MTERIKLTPVEIRKYGELRYRISEQFSVKSYEVVESESFEKQILKDQDATHDWSLVDTLLGKKPATVNNILELVKNLDHFKKAFIQADGERIGYKLLNKDLKQKLEKIKELIKNHKIEFGVNAYDKNLSRVEQILDLQDGFERDESKLIKCKYCGSIDGAADGVCNYCYMIHQDDENNAN